MQMARPERFCFATAQQERRRFALRRPVGAVTDALRCRESATSNLAAARLSNIPTSSGVPDVSPGETVKRKRAPCEGPFSVSLARPERFELPTFWFVG